MIRAARPSGAVDQRLVAEAMRSACLAEIRAFKPGNVSLDSPGHGMTAGQFIDSAEAVAEVLAAPGIGVGERIFRAIEATRRAVGCNTNLGIVLLCAPLAQSVLLESAELCLETRLAGVLAGLDVEDAQFAYRAIRLAAPAGLGRSERHDVYGAPQVTLREAMGAAREVDQIAAQYASGYADIFRYGVPRGRAALEHWGTEEWAAVAIYLGLLARFPDTHIRRKFGAAVAARVSREAVELDYALQRCDKPRQLLPVLEALDRTLKDEGINPGTSADMTVATLLAIRLENLLKRCLTGPAAGRRRLFTIAG